MVDFTLVLKKQEPNSDQRERGDLIFAYETSTQSDPNLLKFDIVKVTNAPAPHANFFRNLTQIDHVPSGQIDPETGEELTTLRNSRCYYIDAEELPPPREQELIDTGTTTIAWGQVKQALRLKSDRILETDDLPTRQGKGTAITDDDVTTNRQHSAASAGGPSRGQGRGRGRA